MATVSASPSVSPCHYAMDSASASVSLAWSESTTPSAYPSTSGCSDTQLTPSQTPSGSVSASPTPTAVPHARRCYLGTSGPCQDDNSVCYSYVPGTTTCPNGSAPFYCPVCVLGTSGPCTNDAGLCSDYADPILHRCEADSIECFKDTLPMPPANSTCAPCAAYTAGHCQLDGTNICFDYKSLVPGETLCPLGTMECASFDAHAQPPSPDCSNCSCHMLDGSCVGYYPGTAVCPAGTTYCHRTGNTVLDAIQFLSAGTSAILHSGNLDYYVLQLVLELALVEYISATASLQSQPCANTGYVPGACLPLVVSFPLPSGRRRVQALSESQQDSNDTFVINGTLTITLPERLSPTLTNETTVMMVSRSELSGVDNPPSCEQQTVTQLPAVLTASGCGADEYVLLVMRKSTMIDPMIVTPITGTPPSARSGLSVIVVGAAVCGLVVLAVGLVVAAARRVRRRETIAPFKVATQSSASVTGTGITTVMVTPCKSESSTTSTIQLQGSRASEHATGGSTAVPHDDSLAVLNSLHSRLAGGDVSDSESESENGNHQVVPAMASASGVTALASGSVGSRRAVVAWNWQVSELESGPNSESARGATTNARHGATMDFKSGPMESQLEAISSLSPATDSETSDSGRDLPVNLKSQEIRLGLPARPTCMAQAPSHGATGNASTPSALALAGPSPLKMPRHPSAAVQGPLGRWGRRHRDAQAGHTSGATASGNTQQASATRATWASLPVTQSRPRCLQVLWLNLKFA